MQKAVETDGLRYRVSSWGKAVNFRQRCYTYRSRLRRLAEKRMGEVPGMEPSIPEDSITIRIEDMDGFNWSSKRPPLSNRAENYDVVLAHRAIDGQTLTLSGEPVEVGEAVVNNKEGELELE
jgi:hypothetical protein